MFRGWSYLLTFRSDVQSSRSGHLNPPVTKGQKTFRKEIKKSLWKRFVGLENVGFPFLLCVLCGECHLNHWTKRVVDVLSYYIPFPRSLFHHVSVGMEFFFQVYENLQSKYHCNEVIGMKRLRPVFFWTPLINFCPPRGVTQSLNDLGIHSACARPSCCL